MTGSIPVRPTNIAAGGYSPAVFSLVAAISPRHPLPYTCNAKSPYSKTVDDPYPQNPQKRPSQPDFSLCLSEN